jgi:hypothetical protein
MSTLFRNLAVLSFLVTGLWSQSSWAGPAAGKAFDVAIRVITASPAPKYMIDPDLMPLAKDLKSLPFRKFKLLDSHQKSMNTGEKISFQFPGKGKRDERFLVVTSHGKQHDGKLRFQLTVKALRFDTLVAVPDGGTILVAGPVHQSDVLLLAVTARKGK